MSAGSKAGIQLVARVMFELQIFGELNQYKKFLEGDCTYLVEGLHEHK